MAALHDATPEGRHSAAGFFRASTEEATGDKSVAAPSIGTHLLHSVSAMVCFELQSGSGVPRGFGHGS
jgi:hypothetical protein